MKNFVCCILMLVLISVTNAAVVCPPGEIAKCCVNDFETCEVADIIASDGSITGCSNLSAMVYCTHNNENGVEQYKQLYSTVLLRK